MELLSDRGLSFSKVAAGAGQQIPEVLVQTLLVCVGEAHQNEPQNGAGRKERHPRQLLSLFSHQNLSYS